jgi:serine/threonine-protein kinase
LCNVTRQSPITDYFSLIPAGEFIYGAEECYERLEQCPPLKPQQTIYLPEFWMAKKPVTYKEWKIFLDETGYKWGGSWHAVVRGWRGIFVRAFAPVAAYPESHGDLPIVDVTQRDALSYCEWLSSKLNRRCMLPTEQQWEKAARGTDGRLYPWGNEKPRPEIQWQKKFPVGWESYFFSLVRGFGN